MALKKNIILESGLSVSNAYIRIDNLEGNKEFLNITTKSYVDSDSATEGKSELSTIRYAFTPSVADGAANFIKQGYEHLKTLDAFAGATDC